MNNFSPIGHHPVSGMIPYQAAQQAASLNTNPWTLTMIEHQQSEGHFVVLRPIDGKVTGEQAKSFFLKSALPPADLAQIWQLADLNKDGKLDRLEFSIAVKLIRNRISGLALPIVLPDSMKQVSVPPQQPLPVMPPRPLSAFGSGMGSTPNLYAAATMGRVGFQGGTLPQQPPSAKPAPLQTPGAPFGSSYSLSSSKEPHDWAMPHHFKLRFSQQFNQLDKGRVGLLSGVQARGVLGESQLPTQILAQIWNLSDVTRDGALSVEEFCTAMFLIEMAKAGFSLPFKLPVELATFCHRSKTISPMSGQSPTDGRGSVIDDPNAPPPQKSILPKTFEDKRRDNFDRGQAELERRRQMLMEEEIRRKAEIERREREEAERKAREREELERRKEAEEKAEMLREKERERARAFAEERAKAEREEARKRMEAERIQELEKARTHQLEQQLASETEKTHQMERRLRTMTLQLHELDERARNLNGEITAARDEIMGITNEIENMREIRDKKLLKIAELEQKNQSLSVQYERVSHESLQLQTDCQKSFSRMNEVTTLRNQISELDRSIDAVQKEILETAENISTNDKLVADKRSLFERSDHKLREIATEYNSFVEQINTKRKEFSEKNNKQIEHESKPALYSEVSQPGQLYDFPPPTDSLKQSSFEDPWAPVSSTAIKDPKITSPFAPVNDSFSSGFASGIDGSSNFEANFSSAFGANNNTANSATSDPWGSSFGQQTQDFASSSTDPFASQSVPEIPLQQNQKSVSLSSSAQSAFNANTESSKQQDSSTNEKGTKLASVKTVKYRAKYAFQARSDDELSIKPGEIILVFEGHDAEPGWLAGQIKTKVGWFPADFAESMVSLNASPATGLKKGTLTSSPSSEPLESIKEEEPVALSSLNVQIGAKMSSNAPKHSEEKTEYALSQAFAKSLAVDLKKEPLGNQKKESSPIQDNGQSHQPSYYDFPPAVDSLEKKNGLETVIGTGTALYQWKARNGNELSFAREDVIEILEQGEMRWRGRLQKNRSLQGWFPKSYVRYVSASTDTALVSPSQTSNKAISTFSKPTATPAASLQNHQKRASVSGGENRLPGNLLSATIPSMMKRSSTAEGIESQQQKPAVLQNGSTLGNSGNKENKAAFVADRSVLQKSDSKSSIGIPEKPTSTRFSKGGDQLGTNGTLPNLNSNEETGIFPANYVQKVSTDSSNSKATASMPSVVPADMVGRVLADFSATAPNQISLKAGDIVRVQNTSLAGWWEGEVDRDGVAKVGWFPGNYIQVLSSDSGGQSAGNAKSSNIAVALYDYSAQHDDELSFKAGEQIEIMEQTDPQWWRGKKVGEKRTEGLIFPSTYVQLRP